MLKKIIRAVLNLLKKTIRKNVLTKTLIEDELPVDNKTMQLLGWLLNPNHLKLIGVVLVGGCAIIALIRSAWEKFTFRSALSREMKKQLEPVYDKLEELEEQNEELKSQNEKLMRQLKKQDQW